MQYVAGGIDEVRSLSRFRPWTILGTGLLVSALTATIPILGGHEVLESGVMTVALPAIGDVKITSALAFDVGVYLLVVGLILMVFESFGDEPPVRAAERRVGKECVSACRTRGVRCHK